MELVILPKDWFFQGDNSRFAPLQKLINKSYDKARYKFDIIRSSRIKTPTSLLTDLCVTKDDEINLFMFLGPVEKFKEEFIRDFSASKNLQEAFSCDIPESLLKEFEFDETDLKISIADPEFVIDDSILSRILGTVGLRSYHEEKISDSIKELELTAFTSFMRITGPKLLDIVISRFLVERYSLYHKILLHADVIREHRLVEYYSQKCGFKQESKEDVLIEAAETFAGNGYLEKGIVASQDFHIAFISREIDVE